MNPRRGAWWALLVLLTLGCGAASTGSEASLVARSSLPATDRDPLPYTPPPADPGLAGETMALAASGGEDQARQMLRALVGALRDVGTQGERPLTALFDEEVGQVADRVATRAGRPRAGIVQRLLIYARRSIIPPEAEVAELFDLDDVEVHRASVFFRNRELPSTVTATDLVVQAPILAPGRNPMRTLFGWSDRGTLVVRPGREPRIVAY